MSKAGNLYAAARVAAGLSSAQMAVAAGLSLGTVRAVEKSSEFGVAGMDDIKATVAAEGDVRLDETSFYITFPKSDETRDIGRLVAVARTIGGLKQNELALASGVSLRTISGLESEKSSMPTNAVRDTILSSLARRGIKLDVDPHSDDRWMVYAVEANEVLPRTPEFPGTTDYEAVLRRMERMSSDLERPHMLRLRIEVDGTLPLVWRELLIPENATFADLHSAVQISFGWHWSHLHAFHLGVLIGNLQELNDGPVSETHALDERLVTLKSIDSSVRSFKYEYDFGDRWVHTIKIGDRLPRGDMPARPILVDGQGGTIIENSHGAELFNELADEIRAGEADADKLDWLYKCGYGRDYDPDAFDVKQTDLLLASAPFDIPMTWEAEVKRLKSVKVAAPHLMEHYPRPPIPSRTPSGGFVVTSIENFSHEDFQRDGLSNPTVGTGYAITTKNPERSVGMRGEYVMGGLANFLDMSSDVGSFETFPLAIRWKVGDRDGVFHPDLRIIDRRGKSRIVHIAMDDEDGEFALRLARSHGIDMTVVASGFLNETAVKSSEKVCRWRRWGMMRKDTDIYRRVAAELGDEVLSRGIGIAAAASLLADKGFDKEEGVQGGTREGRAEAQICAAVADGLIGIDFRIPFERTIVGLPKLGRDTCKFWSVVKPYVMN